MTNLLNRFNIISQNKDICWVLSNIGVYGNDTADKAKE